MLARLLPIVALAVSAAIATPVLVRDSPITLAVARRFNATGAKNIIELDQTRAKFLKSGGSAKFQTASASSAPSVPVTNGAVTYTAEVGLCGS